MKRHRVMVLKMIMTVLVFSAAFSKDLKAAEQGILQTEPTDTIFVELPTEEASSLFDFILDPQRLITETNGAKYGFHTFEPGATLYFENAEDDYDFSSRSDMLSIMNRGDIPVEVTVTAWISQTEHLSIVQTDSFEDEAASIYLAIVDSAGNIQPLDEKGTASVTVRLHAVKENTYDKYSFGLLGACNPNGEWMDLEVHPVVTVTWQVVPVAEREEAQENKQEDTQGEQEEEKEDTQGEQEEEKEDTQGEQEEEPEGMQGE